MPLPTTEFRTGVIRPVECLKEAWAIIKPDYWLFFAITLIGVLIGGVSLYILLGGMICGINYVFLKKIDGEQPVLDDLFKGFGWWLPGLVVTIFIMVPVIIEVVIVEAPLLAAAFAGDRISENQLMAAFGTVMIVDFVFIVAMVCFHTLIVFAFPLIVDRNLGGFSAMLLSAKAVWKNLGGIAGLYGVNFLLTLLGMLACGVGVYFVVPVMLATNVVAYRKIFPSGLK